MGLEWEESRGSSAESAVRKGPRERARCPALQWNSGCSREKAPGGAKALGRLSSTAGAGLAGEKTRD